MFRALLTQLLRWWNGRHACLRGMCRKAWGFKSPPEHHLFFTVRVTKLLAAILFSFALAAGAAELHPVSFSLHAPNARAVFVSGDFNQWSTTATPLKRGQDGRWWVNLRIPAGSYAYKFITDGNWIFDPANPAKTFSGQIQTSKLTVPQAMPGEPVVVKTPAEPAKPVIPFDAAAFQKASEKYAAATAAYQTYMKSRKDPASLKPVAEDLRECAAVFEKYQDSAPRSANCPALLNRCNKLLFDVHATMQVTR